MTRLSRRKSAASSTRGENPFRDADQPVIKTGASSDATAISPSVFHFLNATLRWVYVMITIGTLCRRNNPQVTWAVMGINASAWISKALKVLLNQRRPSSALGIRTDPGMPSSHAYTLLYTTVYIAVALIGWKGLNTITFGIGVTLVVFGAFSAWVRTVEGVHTHSQVMVGIVLGFITAIIWYYAWNTIMLKHLYFFNRVRIFLHFGSIIALLNM
jgi:dolichyldiphosphatase